jgi:anti-sigma B factor antagonist
MTWARMHKEFRSEDGPDLATRSLVPSGELDAAAAAEVRIRIEHALGAGKRRVIVDLSEIAYMETAAVAALLDANARLKRVGASMFIVIPSDSRVRVLFSITRLDKVLRVIGTRDEALRAA